MRIYLYAAINLRTFSRNNSFYTQKNIFSAGIDEFGTLPVFLKALI